MFDLPLVPLLFAVALAGATPQTTSSTSTSPVEALRSWQGISRDSSALRARPQEPFVADAKTWCYLWANWRGNDPRPSVDFRTSVVIVGTQLGPNNAQMALTHDGDGHVHRRVWGTRKGGTGFGYVLWEVSREDLRSVDGWALPGD